MGKPKEKVYSSQNATIHLKLTCYQILGKGRGKLLGFPTINLAVQGSALHNTALDDGIYAAWVTIRGKRFMGALHCGPVPTFHEKEKSVEVFLLDASDETLGETQNAPITVEPVKRVRDVRAFANSQELIRQMRQDVEQVRQILANAG